MTTEVHTHAKIMLSTGAERRPAVNISGVSGTACGQEARGCAVNAEARLAEEEEGVVRSSIIQHHQTRTITWCQQARLKKYLASWAAPVGLEFNPEHREIYRFLLQTSCRHSLLLDLFFCLCD